MAIPLMFALGYSLHGLQAPIIHTMCKYMHYISTLQFLVCHVTQSSQSEEGFVLVGVFTLEDYPSLP